MLLRPPEFRLHGWDPASAPVFRRTASWSYVSETDDSMSVTTISTLRFNTRSDYQAPWLSEGQGVFLGACSAPSACIDAFCDVYQHDAVAVPSEVVLIESQKTLLAVRNHGRHDIRIVDLTPTNRNLTAQRCQFAGDIRAILQPVECRYEPTHVLKCIRHCQRCRPGLWPRYDSQVLAQDLSAYPQLLPTGERNGQSCAGQTVAGREGETSADENVGVNEHLTLSGLGRRRDPHAATTGQPARTLHWRNKPEPQVRVAQMFNLLRLIGTERPTSSWRTARRNTRVAQLA